jgi:hypothetical protein
MMLYQPQMLFSVEPDERMIVYGEQERTGEEMIMKFYVHLLFSRLFNDAVSTV